MNDTTITPPDGAMGLVLVCQSCQEVWEPGRLDDERDWSSCRSCGGWTWTGQVATPVSQPGTSPQAVEPGDAR